MANFFRNFSVRTKYGAMATAVFAGIYVAGVYISRALRKEKPQGPRLTRSMSIAVLHGGQLALQRLLEYHEARADKSLIDVAECELKALLVEKHPDYKKLQSVVAKLEMSGKEAHAVDILKQAIEKAHNEGKNHEAYETEMLLVEMLIYMGEFEQALGCQCLKHVEISDARRPLYKAIIYIMLNENKNEAKKIEAKKHEVKKNEVKECWQEFNDLKSEFHCAPCNKESSEGCQIYKLSTNYNEFEKVVKMLREDIKAQARKN